MVTCTMRESTLKARLSLDVVIERDRSSCDIYRNRKRATKEFELKEG